MFHICVVLHVLHTSLIKVTFDISVEFDPSSASDLQLVLCSTNLIKKSLWPNKIQLYYESGDTTNVILLPF